MASTTATNGKSAAVVEEDDWEYEDEDAEDYEWEYTEEEEEEEEEEDEEVAGDKDQKKQAVVKIVEEEDEEEEKEIPLEEQDLPDPFSSAPLEATTKKDVYEVTNGENGEEKKKHQGERKHKRHHRKSRHLERIDIFNKKKEESSDIRNKKIHVRSKDPSRIARQFEKGSVPSSSGKSRSGRGKAPPPPEQKISQICKICNKEPYLVERIVAERSWWHKNCFRCKQCNKILNLDTYMSHEGVIYCKPHHKELFQPKVVRRDIIDVDSNVRRSVGEDVIQRHQEQSRRMETIIRENNPVQLEDVVRCNPDADKYSGLDDLDVGSKFKMFERASVPERPAASSDRYGIMEKLKRLQEGADLDDLLAEIDEELPSDSEEDSEEAGMTNVQKKMYHAEKMLEEGSQERRKKLAEERHRELKALRSKLSGGNRESILDAFEDVLNQNESKIKKTKVDVRSENAQKFRELFDKGEVPEGLTSNDRNVVEKQQELEQMRKMKREQREFFKLMEEGKLDDKHQKPKLLVGKIKDKLDDESADYDDPEMATLANRFTFFEHFQEKQDELQKRRKSMRLSPTSFKLNNGDDEEEDEVEEGRKQQMSETEIARRECKARSVLNKFKEMEKKVLNGEDEARKDDDPDKPVISALGFLGRLPGVGDKPRMKRFTPPRKLIGGRSSDSESDYSDSEYTGSYTGSSSYTESESEGEIDETLKAMRAAARAKELREKFEKWEESQDAQEQMQQIMLHDETGESIETASNLRARFENMRMQDTEKPPPPRAPKRFTVRRFK